MGTAFWGGDGRYGVLQTISDMRVDIGELATELRGDIKNRKEAEQISKDRREIFYKRITLWLGIITMLLAIFGTIRAINVGDLKLPDFHHSSSDARRYLAGISKTVASE